MLHKTGPILCRSEPCTCVGELKIVQKHDSEGIRGDENPRSVKKPAHVEGTFSYEVRPYTQDSLEYGRDE